MYYRVNLSKARFSGRCPKKGEKPRTAKHHRDQLREWLEGIKAMRKEANPNAEG